MPSTGKDIRCISFTSEIVFVSKSNPVKGKEKTEIFDPIVNWDWDHEVALSDVSTDCAELLKALRPEYGLVFCSLDLKDFPDLMLNVLLPLIRNPECRADVLGPCGLTVMDVWGVWPEALLVDGL